MSFQAAGFISHGEELVSEPCCLPRGRRAELRPRAWHCPLPVFHRRGEVPAATRRHSSPDPQGRPSVLSPPAESRKLFSADSSGTVVGPNTELLGLVLSGHQDCGGAGRGAPCAKRVQGCRPPFLSPASDSAPHHLLKSNGHIRGGALTGGLP